MEQLVSVVEGEAVSVRPPRHPMRAARTVVAFFGRGWRAVRWYVRELMGDSAYEHYLERFAIDHAGVEPSEQHEPLTEREFWRQRIDNQPLDAHCC